jgi:hypothetical protein
MVNTNASKQTIPWALIMTFILLVIKVVWVPAMSWWIVFLPLLVVGAFIVGVLVIVLAVAGIVAFLDR